ncbi:MAG: LamG domain-containing protein [Bryobacterales bacterium]|nr:LamG domain-containing protein [Bryobacterales bacterium]
MKRFSLFLAVLSLVSCGGRPAFRAGAHAVDITPTEFPVIVSGSFLSKTGTRAEGKLHARSIVLDDGATRIVLCVVDNLMMPRDLLDKAKALASEATGIPPDRMLISATHSHSAPSVMGALGTEVDETHRERLPGWIAESIAGAVKNLEPARAGWLSVDAPHHTHCRRWIARPDRIGEDPFGERTVRANMHPGYQNPEFIGPAGPVDSGLSLLSLQSRDGKQIALLANYSMHYVGAPGDAVSPDYFGPFAELMETKIGGIAIMSQGTSGDQHWMDYGQPRQQMTAARFAEELAAQAHEAFGRIQYRDTVPLAMAEAALPLSRRQPSPERLTWARKIVAELDGRLPENRPEVYAREQIYVSEEPRRELKLQALRIGDLGITAIPNEVYGITGLKLKAMSPFETTFNIELANGAEGYIPPPEQHKLGGYTTWEARTAGLEVTAEPKIVETLLTLLEQVAGKPRRTPATAGETYAATVLDTKPLAYWRMDEFAGPQAHDRGPNAHHGVYEDGVAFYLPGTIHRAAQFAGGRLTSSLAPPAGTRSVSLWFWNGLPAGTRDVTGYLAEWGGDRLAIGRDGRLALGGLAGKSAIEPRTWYHTALVRDGGTARVYLNGRLEIEGPLADANAVEGLFLGGDSRGKANFEGRIAEAAVFGRVLSAEEITRLSER